MTRVTSFLTVGLMALIVPLAHANVEISWRIGGVAGTTGNCGAGTPTLLTCAPISSGGVTITNLSGFSNSPGGIIAQQFGSTLNVTNDSGATVVAEFWVAADGFLSPVTPPELVFASSLTTNSTLGSGTSDLTSCVDNGNVGVPFGSPVVSPFCASLVSETNATQNYVAASSNHETIKMSIASLTAPYTLSQHITLSLGAGSSMDVTASNVLTSVPEPGAIVLFGTALALCASRLRRRNRA